MKDIEKFKAIEQVLIDLRDAREELDKESIIDKVIKLL